jgi:hypothetical protein
MNHSLLVPNPDPSRSESTYYSSISLCFRSLLDDGKAFLSTADNAAVTAPDAVKKVPGFEGVRYRAAFPATRPPGSNFYPADMTKQVQLRIGRVFRDCNAFVSCFLRASLKQMDVWSE